MTATRQDALDGDTTAAIEQPREPDATPSAPVAESPTTPRAPWYRRVDRALVGFCLLSLLIGSAFALITPPMWGADESSHIARAWSISEGVVFSHELDTTPGADRHDSIPASVDDLAGWMSPLIDAHPSSPFPQIADPGRIQALEAAPLESAPRQSTYSGARNYHPVAYVPFLAGLAVAKAADLSVGTTLYLMRLLGVLSYTALVAAGVAVLRGYRARWLVVAAGLIPMSLFQAATISADTLTLGLSFLVGALIIKAAFLRRRLPPVETVALFVAAALIPLCKAGYVVFLPLVLLVPAGLLWGRWRAKAAGSITLVVGALVFYFWTRATTPETAVQRVGSGPISPGGQIAFMLDQPVTFAHVIVNTLSAKGTMYFLQFFGDLGFTFVPIPATSTIAIILAIVLVFGNSERLAAPLGTSLGVTILLLLGIASVFGALWLNWTPVGFYIIEGVQGRYFLPFAVLVLGVTLRFVPLRWHLPRMRDHRACELGALALMALALVLSALNYYFIVWV